MSMMDQMRRVRDWRWSKTGQRNSRIKFGITGREKHNMGQSCNFTPGKKTRDLPKPNFALRHHPCLPRNCHCSLYRTSNSYTEDRWPRKVRWGEEEFDW